VRSWTGSKVASARCRWRSACSSRRWEPSTSPASILTGGTRIRTRSVVDAPPEYIDSEYDWQHDEGLITPERPFQVPFAPDYLHKADISGGLPYGIAVPNAGVDGLVLGDIHQTTFTNYLRIAFRWPASRDGRSGRTALTSALPSRRPCRASPTSSYPSSRVQ
jgi:hypothetical protein